MKKYFLLLLTIVCSTSITQAQKTKKQVNNGAAAAEDKGWKPTKGDTRNPFDTIKTKQVKANGLGAGEDPFEKTAKLKGELTTYKKSNARSRKGTNSKTASFDPRPGGINYDSLKVKPVKANGLGAGEDPFDKTGGKRKKTAAKKNGYANQEISYANPNATETQNTNTPKPVKGKKQIKPIGGSN